MRIYVETGSKRVFAGALEWPGWCRSARDEAGAVEALLAYAPRYRAVVARARTGFRTPARSSAFKVVERLRGDATTDFGAPSVAPRIDAGPLDAAELARQTRVLRACWRAFDAAVDAARGAALRKGTRGGGRELDAIRAHLLDSDKAYLRVLGGSVPGDDAAAIRAAFLGALEQRARGEVPDAGPRGGKRWGARYAIRRAAWHALDHAWEIEDRAV